jgi:hypothetical protein
MHMREGYIPLRLAITLKDGTSTREIPLNEVGRIAFRDDPDHMKAKVMPHPF